MKKSEFDVVGEIALDDLITQPTEAPQSEMPSDRIDGIVIARLIGLAADGRAIVDFDGGSCDEPVTCESLASLDDDMIDRHVALMFRDGDPDRPLVLGVIQNAAPARKRAAVEVAKDGETLELTADKEIVLRCGEASLTLTRSGKVIIRGAYISSRASGVNRVNGASVQIN
jgi:hypothetical protein